jgi:hypothetical protein
MRVLVEAFLGCFLPFADCCFLLAILTFLQFHARFAECQVTLNERTLKDRSLNYGVVAAGLTRSGLSVAFG